MIALPEFRPFRVLGKTPLTERSFALFLVPDDGAPIAPFRAGQWAMLRLRNPDGTPWGQAAFSFVTAPSAVMTSLEFGIKRAGEFTRRLDALQVGDVLDLRGPYGVFTPKEEEKELICFSGGIGVTPFVCMAREIAAGGLARTMTLMTSNGGEYSAPYLHELRNLAAATPALRLVETFSSTAPEGWTGERGRIDAAMLARQFPSFTDSEIMACGSADFLGGVMAALEQRGVSADRVVREKFF